MFLEQYLILFLGFILPFCFNPRLDKSQPLFL